MTRVTETWRAKLFYGFGSLAYGVKDNAFQIFLLYYYTLILHMPAVSVGSALLIAVLIDSVTDPIVGQFSDNLRTRFGRRHPLMFAAAIPVTISFYFLWTPPQGLSDGGLFWYLLVFASITRIFITFYEIPATALISELTQDYDHRIHFASLRYFFAWIGGGGLMMFALATFFATSEAYPNGLMNPDAYPRYALLGAGMILFSIIVSATGTLRYLPNLIEDKSPKIIGLGAIFKNLYRALTDRVFAPLFVNAILSAMGFGLSVSLSLFFNTYFWEFSATQMVTLGLAVLLGAVIAPLLAPLATRGKLGKRRAAIRLASVAVVLIPLPVALRLLGYFPENGAPELLPLIFLHQMVIIGIGVSADILVQAMVADVVDDNERRTGRRSAGVFFAARTFASKSTNGLGLFIGASIAAAAGLEKGMSPDKATPEMVATLGYYYVPVIIAIYVTSIYLLTHYKVTRARHAENLQALKTVAGE